MHPATSRPTAPGLYEVRPPISVLRSPSKFYAWWTGAQWGPVSRNPARASDPQSQATRAHVQDKQWKEIES